MASNVLATQLLRQSKRRLLAEIFFEIRFNKEIEKLGFELKGNSWEYVGETTDKVVAFKKLKKMTKKMSIKLSIKT